jgi:hypothetical protein
MRTILLSIVVLGAVVQTARADSPPFALHGLTHDQFARVSVANMGTTTCNVTLQLLDQDNDVIASQTSAIAPGDQAALAVSGADLVPRGALRTLVRPVVIGAPPGPCVPSFMIRDTTTGATTFATTRFYPPGPCAPPGPCHVFRGTSALVVPNSDQRALLVLANTGADPSGPVCQATLTINVPGKGAIASKTVTLAPGSATTLEVAGGGTALWGNIALAEDPATPGFPPGPCMGTFELYNAANGATRLGAAVGFSAP